MWQILTPIVAIGLMLAVPAVYDVAVILAGERSISALYKIVGHTWSPVFIYGVSVLPGHWWVNFEESLVGMAGGGGLAELFVVCWIGWVIHWTFRANPELTPLGPWESLGLIFFSVLVGATMWTLTPVT